MSALGWVCVSHNGVPYIAGSSRPLARDEAQRCRDFLASDDVIGDYRVHAVVPADEYDAVTDVDAAVEPVIDMEAVGRVRALHKARPVGAFDYCEHCEWTWPCPTIRVIEATP